MVEPLVDAAVPVFRHVCRHRCWFDGGLDRGRGGCNADQFCSSFPQLFFSVSLFLCFSFSLFLFFSFSLFLFFALSLSPSLSLSLSLSLSRDAAASPESRFQVPGPRFQPEAITQSVRPMALLCAFSFLFFAARGLWNKKKTKKRKMGWVARKRKKAKTRRSTCARASKAKQRRLLARGVAGVGLFSEGRGRGRDSRGATHARNCGQGGPRRATAGHGAASQADAHWTRLGRGGQSPSPQSRRHHAHRVGCRLSMQPPRSTATPPIPACIGR